MKIERIKIENYGAIEDLQINFETVNSELPFITVIVGANGSGKTLFLSHIVDSIIELKRKKFVSLHEVDNDNYFKVGHQSYIRYGKQHSYVNLLYSTESGNEIRYVDIMSKNPQSFIGEYQEQVKNLNLQNPKFLQHGYHKEVLGDIGEELDKNIILYFPATRYSEPSWINKENQSYRLKNKEIHVGQSTRNIIKENVLYEMENWILNLVLDKHLYEIKTEKTLVRSENGQMTYIDHVIYLNGRNTQLLDMLNKLLTIIYELKFPKIQYARIGVSSKEDRKIAVIIKEIDGEEIEVSPTFGHLSSGEAMLISLFGSLLKEYDEVSGSQFKDINDITGIVLIDEIDLNLHIKFAKEILPQLLRQFPKVQFIVTTHSPFFLLGMESNCEDVYKIYSLPEGQGITAFDFQEVQLAYKTFIESFADFQNEFNMLKNQLSILTKPLIITEGKTDWKHFKGVLERFKENGEFEELDIVFLEDNNISLSDDKLNKMLLELAKVISSKKIIGIFDSDAKNGKEYSKSKFTDLGNNVYAMSIPTPYYREEHKEGISIEFLYKDEDLLKFDNNGRRIFLSSEFNSNGRLKDDLLIGVRNLDAVKNYLEVSNAKIVDSDVINIEGNSIALTKNTFANHILKRNEPFYEIDIEGFREVFNIINEIILEQ